MFSLAQLLSFAPSWMGWNVGRGGLVVEGVEKRKRPCGSGKAVEGREWKVFLVVGEAEKVR